MNRSWYFLKLYHPIDNVTQGTDAPIEHQMTHHSPSLCPSRRSVVDDGYSFIGVLSSCSRSCSQACVAFLWWFAPQVRGSHTLIHSRICRGIGDLALYLMRYLLLGFTLPGGNLLTLVGNGAGRAQKAEGDKWGRFCCQTMWGARDEGIIVITAYRVCQEASDNPVPYTAYT